VCALQTFLIRMTQLVPQTRFSEFEKTSTVSLSGTGTFATVCKVSIAALSRWRGDRCRVLTHRVV